MKKIVVIGATGFTGSAIISELVSRDHKVLGISRKEKYSDSENLSYAPIDVHQTAKLAEVLKGNDIIISAFNPGRPNPNAYSEYIAGAKSILEAVRNSGVKRFIVIGGAGSLYVADGVQMVDTMEKDNEYFQEISAARDFLNIMKEDKELDWAFFSPAFEMHPGIKTGRTGKYRLGLDTPVVDDNSRSILSVQDLAVVVADEVENPRHHQVRFTAGY